MKKVTLKANLEALITEKLERYGGQVYHFSSVGIKAVGYSTDSRFNVLGYSTRNSNPLRPVFNFSRKTQAEVVQAVAKVISSLEERKAKKTQPHTLEVGNILYTCWGYEQTNISFYRVEEVKSSSVILVNLNQTQVEDRGMALSGYTVPTDEVKPKAEPFMKRVTFGKEVNLGSSEGRATLWDGKPKSYSNWY